MIIGWPVKPVEPVEPVEPVKNEKCLILIF